MRISDWSSDVCSSDLFGHAVGARALEADDDDDVAVELARLERRDHLILVVEDARGCLDRPAILGDGAGLDDRAAAIARQQQNGRASCRERVCQYVWLSGVAGSFKKKKK